MEVAKAMSSLVQYLKFEGEDAEMFSSNELPTLDTSIWWTGERLMFRFFEKPTVPNRVLQKQTALSEDCIRASLNQEVVRRLLSCSPDLPLCEKRDILSKFAQKLVNSGFSVASSRITLVHGVSRYLELVRNSKLSVKSPRFKPLYNDKSFRKFERILAKFESKSGWYAAEKLIKSEWRSKLPVEWRGSRPAQHKLPGMPFTSVLQVQNSKGGRLLKELAKIEPRLAKSTGYQVKLVEKGGRPLSHLFNKNLGPL